MKLTPLVPPTSHMTGGLGYARGPRRVRGTGTDYRTGSTAVRAVPYAYRPYAVRAGQPRAAAPIGFMVSYMKLYSLSKFTTSSTCHRTLRLST